MGWAYVCRDLRRALTVAVDTHNGAQRIKITIPDFYETDGTPRDPVIAGGSVFYGDKANPVRVAYYKSGSVIYRSVNDVPYELATDVELCKNECSIAQKQCRKVC